MKNIRSRLSDPGMAWYLALVLFHGLLSSCNEEAVDWELDTRMPDLLVVEGVITNRLDAHEVRISRPFLDPNGRPEPVQGAIVAIADGENAQVLKEQQPGIYRTEPDQRAIYGKLYTLFIAYEGREYYANSFMVPVLPLTPLIYKRLPDHENWYELELNNTADPSMVEIRLDWSHVPGFRNLPAEETHARIVYYTIESIDVNEIFKPGSERVVFPVGTRVVRRKYSMNRFQQEFVRTLMSETKWRGGFFDVQPGNVETNLTEGAVGYFSVSMMVSDSSYITPANSSN